MEKLRKKLGLLKMDNKYRPIGQMMEKCKSLDFSKVAPIYPTIDYDFINRQMQEHIQELEVDPIIPEGYFDKSQEYQQQSLEMLKSINQNTANFIRLWI